MSAATRSAPRVRLARSVATLWLATGSLLLTGCQFHGLADLPLPGGAASDGHAYHVTVQFEDVMDLVPQAAVKVNDVTVGAVEKVELDGWQARVRLRIADSVKLPANAIAELQQTSMLGEKYVSLSAPTDVPPVGRLSDGAQIPLSRSGRNPDVEEVLSALSAMLNGGGVAQLHTITVELNSALQGREGRVKSLLSQLSTFISGLDQQRSEIVRAMDGIDRLAKTLSQQNPTIGQAVDSMPPALKILADQRSRLTTMLTALSNLGTVGSRVISASRDDTVADLQQLQPILTELNKAGDDLPNALELLTTYPFPRNVVGAIKGDYTNLHITADLDLNSIYGKAGGSPKPGPSAPTPGLPTPGLPKPPPLPGLPSPPHVPIPTPSLPCVQGTGCGNTPSPKPSGGGGVLCPPVCTGTNAAYTSGGSGDESDVDLALADLMTRGMQP
ncbi:MCE family protein [Streptantibioticus rubrisoli]|uniref:MCE family protein n=1 Tax=Streptantibioticus rubrisoli TaxID=1387313 RepID=A0ABT1PD52_9ACTN|nr:MCE family protein [Streptantibioticus rubrisoli]MCQ4043294.1 MCE family protein [Streptantibioticus rubrisoli]